MSGDAGAGGGSSSGPGSIGVINVLMAGVGGQGLILAARVLGDAAIASNTHCITSEVHGMAQRGGMVTCLVRLGDVSGPLMAKGAADVLLGYEPLEALRAQREISARTTVILNSNRIIPFTVSSGDDEYPSMDEIVDAFKGITELVYTVDINRLAKEAGAPQALNIVLLGAIAHTGKIPFGKDVLIESIKKNVPPRFVEANLKALELGYDALE